MRAFFLSFMAMLLICPAVALRAQSGEGERLKVSDDDRAAVAAYTEATKALSQKVREARKEIRAKNSELAKVLAREKAEYKEQDVLAAHKALTEAHTAMIAAELEGLLLYKAYHPEWKPEADGRRVLPPTERGERRGQADEGEAPQDVAPEKKAK